MTIIWPLVCSGLFTVAWTAGWVVESAILTAAAFCIPLLMLAGKENRVWPSGIRWWLLISGISLFALWPMVAAGQWRWDIAGWWAVTLSAMVNGWNCNPRNHFRVCLLAIAGATSISVLGSWLGGTLHARSPLLFGIGNSNLGMAIWIPPFIFAVLSLWTYRRAARATDITSCAVGCVSILLLCIVTGRRGALIALTLSLFLFIILYNRASPRTSWQATLLLPSLLLTIIASLFFVFATNHSGEGTNSRWMLYPAVWDLILSSPIYGSGPDAMLHLPDVATAGTIPYNLTGRWSISAHNVLADAWLRGGIFSLAGIVMIGCACAQGYLNRPSRSKLPILCSVVAILVMSMLDPGPYQVAAMPITGFFLSALAKSESDKVSKNKSKWIASTALCSLALVSAPAAFRSTASAVLHRQATPSAMIRALDITDDREMRYFLANTVCLFLADEGDRPTAARVMHRAMAPLRWPGNTAALTATWASSHDREALPLLLLHLQRNPGARWAAHRIYTIDPSSLTPHGRMLLGLGAPPNRISLPVSAIDLPRSLAAIAWWSGRLPYPPEILDLRRSLVVNWGQLPTIAENIIIESILDGNVTWPIENGKALWNTVKDRTYIFSAMKIAQTKKPDQTRIVLESLGVNTLRGNPEH